MDITFSVLYKFCISQISFSVSRSKYSQNVFFVSLSATATLISFLFVEVVSYCLVFVFCWFLRSWTDLDRGVCALVSTSINHPKAPPSNGVTAIVLASRYLVEPLENGKSRLTHISRVDQRLAKCKFV